MLLASIVYSNGILGGRCVFSKDAKECVEGQMSVEKVIMYIVGRSWESVRALAGCLRTE